MTHNRIFRVWVATTALVLLGMAVAAWPSARAHLQSVAILKIVSGSHAPWWTESATAGSVSSQDIDFPSASGPIRGRLYLPARPRRAQTIVILHGVHHLGIDEPRLVAFSRAMAACGLQVLTPELPDIKDYRVDQSSVSTIGESANWFAHRTGTPVGVMGLSFSGGLALVAATEPAYASSIKYVFAVGSQDEMSRVVRYYKTGEDIRPNRSVERLAPHEYGSLVLEYAHLEDFVPEQENFAPIRAVLRAHLYEDKPAEQQAMAALTDQQRAEVAPLMDINSESTKAALTASEAKHLDEMEALSPHGKIASLHKPVFLLHGEADNIIPSAESLWLAADLPRDALGAVLVTPVISHVDMDNTHPPGLLDQWRLIHFMALVMEEAERR